MSKIESRFQDYLNKERFEGLIDKNGDTFNIETDAFYGDTYIELKEHPLNTKTSLSACYNKLCSQLQYRSPNYKEDPRRIPKTWNEVSSILWKLGYHRDCLNYAWNHSAAKTSLVSEYLQGLGFQFIVVFSDHPTTKEYRGKNIPFKDYYKNRYNLDTMLEHEAWEWIQGPSVNTKWPTRSTNACVAGQSRKNLPDRHIFSTFSTQKGVIF